MDREFRILLAIKVAVVCVLIAFAKALACSIQSMSFPRYP